MAQSQAQRDAVAKAAQVSAENRRRRAAERRAKAERDAVPHSERPRVWETGNPAVCVCRLCVSGRVALRPAPTSGLPVHGPITRAQAWEQQWIRYAKELSCRAR